MKKRFLPFLLASTFAVGSAFGLAACGGDDSVGGKPGDDDNSGSGTYKSEKIDSAEAWAAAMDLSAVTNGSICITGVDGITLTEYYDGSKLKRVSESMDGAKSQTRFYEFKADEPYSSESEEVGTEYCYKYDGDADEWTVEKGPMYDGFSLHDTFCDGFNEVIGEDGEDEQDEDYEGLVSQRYANFKYDESKGAYIATYESIGDYLYDVYVEVKFKDGKISDGVIKGDYADEGSDEAVNIEITLKIYDLGATTVTLPQISAKN